jgi:hypothetical protein
MKFAADFSLTGSDRSSIVKNGFARSNPLEFSMFARSFFAAASLFIAVAVMAQTAGPAPKRPVLGKAINVKGLVTVSDAQGVSRVVSNNDVIDHNRYVTSSTGYVTLKMDKGCDIELKPNQALTVEDEKSCDALWAAIESLDNPAGILLAGGGAAGAAAAGGGSLVPFVIGGAAILLLDGGGSGGGGSGGGGSGGGDGGSGGNQNIDLPPPPPVSPQ